MSKLFSTFSSSSYFSFFPRCLKTKKSFSGLPFDVSLKILFGNPLASRKSSKVAQFLLFPLRIFLVRNYFCVFAVLQHPKNTKFWQMTISLYFVTNRRECIVWMNFFKAFRQILVSIFVENKPERKKLSPRTSNHLLLTFKSISCERCNISSIICWIEPLFKRELKVMPEIRNWFQSPLEGLFKLHRDK